MEPRHKIPTLDCSKIAGNLEDIKYNENFKSFSQQLGDGIRNSGFVYLINHDVKPETISGIFSKSLDFFKLPSSVKNKYTKINAPTNFHGFTGAGDENVASLVGKYNDESVIDRKETFDVWGLAAKDPANYPAEVPNLKDAFDTLRSSLIDLTGKLFYAFAIYLRVDDSEFFSKCHTALLQNSQIKSHNFMRANYYYAMDPTFERNGNQQEPIRLGEHCDIDTFSFLFQDEVGGLEARVPGGDWIQVPPLKDSSIVFNLGYMMEVWAGGHLPATPHRVRWIKDSVGRVRQSVALFVQPDGDAVCKPIVEEKEGWIPPFPIDVTQTHFDYFSGVLRQVRSDY